MALCDAIDVRVPSKGKTLFDTVISRAVDSIDDYPSEVGPAMAQREKRKAELDEQIGKLEAEYIRMRDAADASGARFERLDSIPAGEKQIARRVRSTGVEGK